MNFPKLESAMIKSGFSKEITDTALEWLDIGKERDKQLFDKLTLQEDMLKAYRTGHFRENLGEFRYAVQQEFFPLNSDELYMRYMIMSYKLLDAAAEDLIKPMYLGSARESWAHFDELYNKALTEVYGDKAKAHKLAADYSWEYYVNSGWLCKGLNDTETILEAAEVTCDVFPEVKALLCANAFEYMPLPDGEKLSEQAARAVSVMKSVMKCDIEKDSVSLLAALASASYFDKELKSCFEKYAAAKARAVAGRISSALRKCEHAADALFSVEGTLNKDTLALFFGRGYGVDTLLMSAAKMQTETFKKLMLEQDSFDDIAKMNNAIKAVKPDEAVDTDIYKGIAAEKIIKVLPSCYEDADKIKAFIKGEIPLGEVFGIIKKTKLGYRSPAKVHYIQNFGTDDFIMRCMIVIGGSVGRYSDHLGDITNFSMENIPELIKQLYACGATSAQAIDICGNLIEHFSGYGSYSGLFAEGFAPYIDKIAKEDITKCCAEAKIMALELFKKDENKYRKNIVSVAGDTAKAVRDTAAEIILRHPDWSDDVKALLASKKSSARDFALTVIERQGAKAYVDELKKALSAEKTDKLKARIGSVLATVSGVDIAEEKASAVDIVKEMTKGKKTSKLDWLFKEPFSPVHKKDGTVADESYLKALMLCFANSVGLKDPNADIIVSELEAGDVCDLANEVLNRWLTTPPEVKSEWMQFLEEYSGSNTLGAQAKYKWVLYMASVYGGKKALAVFDDLMSSWPLYQKGALAKEIPHAIVLNGSSSYIMLVEKMSRKHRFNSIRKASADALLCASEKLGISKEEFADKMIPDLDFDENMCRTFDYGSRQFKVYISPKLEPEIYCGDKKLKSMPKPGADEGSKAEAAYKEFTAMKKLMKTIVAAQLVRLENTMRTARSWTSENWKKLFVANPIMHRFAIGLIWGIYKDNKLEKSFRYLDDGSFTTVDEEEFTIPENAQIGLVHPVELPEKELSAWKQQIKDYEIVQPFAQLDRDMFRPTDEEKGKDCIERFKGKVVKSIGLASAMNKIGWSKGAAGDGAMIDDFLREDVFSRNEGIKASLRHSGMSVEIYRSEEVDVTVEELYFYKLPDGGRMTVGELRDRYFSEIMYQLSKVFV